MIIGQQAWPLSHLQAAGRIEFGDLTLEWMPGQFAAPDIFGKDLGRDIGSVNAHRRHEEQDLLVPESFRVNLTHSFRTFAKGGTIEIEPAE